MPLTPAQRRILEVIIDEAGGGPMIDDMLRASAAVNYRPIFNLKRQGLLVSALASATDGHRGMWACVYWVTDAGRAARAASVPRVSTQLGAQPRPKARSAAEQ